MNCALDLPECWFHWSSPLCCGKRSHAAIRRGGDKWRETPPLSLPQFIPPFLKLTYSMRKACISITFFLPSLPRQSQKDDSVFLHIQSCCCFNMVVLQGSAKRRSPGLVNFVPAVTDHFCMAQPSAFTQPGDRLLAEPCLCYGLMNASLIVPRWLFFLARRREGRISGSLHVARRGTRGR